MLEFRGFFALYFLLKSRLKSDLSPSSSKSAPHFGECTGRWSSYYDPFNAQNLELIPINELIIREISFNADPEKKFLKTTANSQMPMASSNSKRLRTLKFLKMLNNSNSSSSSDCRDREEASLLKPRKHIKLCDLFESLRRRCPEKMKLSFLKKADLPKKHEELAQNIAYDEHILITTLYLPLTIQRKNDRSDYEISFRYSKPLFELESFLITRLLTHYKKMVWVGLLKDLPLNIDPKALSELRELAFDKYKCKVLIPPLDSEDWTAYYKRFWNPMMQNRLDIGKITALNRNHSGLRDSLLKFQQWFRRAVDSLLEESSLVVILDNFLSFLCEGLFIRGVKVALYSQFGFPASETRLLNPFSDEEIISGFLNTHVLAFNSYKQAKRLVEASEKNGGGWKIESERGSLNLARGNRRIALKTVYPGLDLNHLEQNMKKTPEFLGFYKDFSKEIKGRKVLLCIDTLEDYKGVEQRLLFLKRFLIETSNKYHLKVFLLLKIKNNGIEKTPGGVLQDELFNIRDLINKINNTVFNNPFESEGVEDFISTISLFESPFPRCLIAAAMCLSSVYLVHSLSEEESLLNALEFIALTEENGVCLVSEFAEKIGSSFNGVFSYNPYKYESLKEKLKLVLGMDQTVLKEISNNDRGLLRKSSVLNWFEGIIIELKRTMRKATGSDLNDQRPSGFSTEAMLLKPLTSEFEPYQLIDLYKSSKNRLFFFGNLSKPQTRRSYLKPLRPVNFQMFPLEVLKTLEILANDPKNTLFLISDESLEVLDLAAKKIRNLGLLSEHGFFYRTDGKQRWRALINMDLTWKSRVLGIMREFKRRTEGSEIVTRDSFVKWSFEDCEPELARKQASELENTLRNELRNEMINKIEVVHSETSVEVRPFGVNKTNMVELVIQKVFLEKGHIDFIVDFEEYGGQRKRIRGESISDGIGKMIRENPSCFEPVSINFINFIRKHAIFNIFQLKIASQELLLDDDAGRQRIRRG